MNTSNTSVISRPPPSRWWYVFAAFLVVCGLVFMAAFMVPRIMAVPDTLQRGVVPGAIEIVVNTPGSFTIFHESESVVDGEVFSSGDVSGLRVQVLAPSGGAVPVVPAGVRSRYAVGGRSGAAIFAFDANLAGTYKLVADYKSGAAEPRVVLAVGTGFLQGLLVTIFGALGIAGAGIGGGGLVTILTYRKRKAAKAAHAK